MAPTSTLRRAFGVGTQQSPTDHLHVTLHANASSSGRTFTLPSHWNGFIISLASPPNTERFYETDGDCPAGGNVNEAECIKAAAFIGKTHGGSRMHEPHKAGCVAGIGGWADKIVFNTAPAVGTKGKRVCKNENRDNNIYSNTDKWFHTYVNDLAVLGVSNNHNEMPILAGNSNVIRLFYVANGCSLSLTNIQIKGKGIYINRGNGHFDAVLFTENVAKIGKGGGGALLIHASSNVTVHHSSFVNNSAIDRGGGAIHLRPSSAIDGGNRALFGSTLTIKNCTFSGNRAHANGGAISIDDRTITAAKSTSIIHVNLYNTTFLDNVVSNVDNMYRVGNLVANEGFQCLKSDGISWTTHIGVSSWYGSLASAKSKCDAHPDCKLLHDYNNDGTFCCV